ncbi:hypothetical protein CDL15_Pgr010483 [Punica granatum]|uniref:Uncharacterized protein n=1 Tax=Punica granatum TaxID=22663 RepID=A0A218XVX1_PUNGR|nr:hypothetical protein CDL15_Pgr010483 [Punica granatum]
MRASSSIATPQGKIHVPAYVSKANKLKAPVFRALVNQANLSLEDKPRFTGANEPLTLAGMRS